MKLTKKQMNKCDELIKVLHEIIRAKYNNKREDFLVALVKIRDLVKEEEDD
ncbi:MAG: hypothetical protein J6S67_12235 [Methanobrevibacter sp.]|nr:hypothetical protein [Methanobrevibacter sp.]